MVHIVELTILVSKNDAVVFKNNEKVTEFFHVAPASCRRSLVAEDTQITPH